MSDDEGTENPTEEQPVEELPPPREPQKMRMWCVACKQELQWLTLQAGRSRYDHQAGGPTDHRPVMTMRDPNAATGAE